MNNTFWFECDIRYILIFSITKFIKSFIYIIKISIKFIMKYSLINSNKNNKKTLSLSFIYYIDLNIMSQNHI